jgi:hypothetical protein
MSNAGTLETIAAQIGLALQPLENQLTSGNVIPFLAQMGLQFPPQLTAQSAFMDAVNAASTATGALTNLLTQLATDISSDNDGGILQDGIQLIQQIGTIISALETIGTQLGSIAASLPGMNSAEVQTFAENLASNLLSYLLISYLEQVQSGAVGITNLLGIVKYAFNPGVAGDPTHPPYITKQLQLSNIASIISSPTELLQTLFGWGTPGFDATLLAPALNASLNLLGFYSKINTGPPISLSAGMFSVSANSATNPPGLLASLTYSLPAAFNYTLPLTDVWSIQAQVQGSFNAGLSATITPPISVALQPPSGTLNGQVQMSLAATATDANDPLILIGETGGSAVQTNSFTFGAGVNATWNIATNMATADPSVTLAVSGGKVIIDMSDSDGFLATILSGIDVQAGFDLNATWRLDTGLHITGGAQLEIDLPLHLDLGPVSLPTLYLIGGLANNTITLEVSAALGITLGPISGSVDRVGLLGTLTFPQSGGNLGPANLQLAFKPPNGLGLSIDAGVVTGGGYISFDPTKGQYAGILQMSLVDTIGITVIGVIDTIMPDGSTGFSFILIITFTLPPIQLGFGFTLNGVGGLGGVNRGMDTNALQAGFQAHTLDAIMFPSDPIDNAPQIISEIQSFFPIAQGNYIFGPLLEIGWGEPTLITFTVGVILSVPNPIIIAILGLIDAGLPTEDEALIEIHIEVLGIIDFGTKTLSIDGSMYDSTVLIYALAGDLALRLSWGSNPNFLYSLGGFNPNFNTDGLDVPQMARLSVSLGYGDNPRISSNSYFAVTSNTVQFGANVQAYASAGGFSIQGYLGFDVLIVLSPFSFEFDFNCNFDIAYDGTTLMGLNVDGLFQGPTPWNFQGSVSITFLFFTVSASVNLTWGNSNQATIPSKPVLPDLFTALQNPQDWSAALPAATTVGVSFATPNPNDTTLCVHPMGTLQVKEKVVPLDLPITMYGNATPSDGTEFSIQSVQINAQTESITTIQDYFAPGQFLTLSDADKLSNPSFELYDAGVDIGSSAILNGQDSPRTVTYNEFYIYDLAGFSQFSQIYHMPANIHLALSAQGAGFTSPAKNTGLGKYSDGQTSSPIAVNQPQYVVTSVNDLSVRSDIAPGSGTSYFQAKAALGTYLATNPAESQDLQIIPLHEVLA